MAFLVFFLIWYFAIIRNSPEKFRKFEGKLKGIIIALVVFTMFSSFIEPLLILSLVLLGVFSPVLIFGFVIYKLLGGGKKKNKKGTLGAVSSAMDNLSTGLTRSVPKRKKIIKKFCKKYDISLTEEEMDRIVDGSYMSFAWEKEIYDMQADYDTLLQWLTGNSSWLRAYLKVFSVHTISTDFMRQRQVCKDTFAQIFDEVNPGAFGTVEDCIDAINNEYFSFFDEATFMLIYRFLEKEGKNYNLPALDIIKNESELDKLRRKYDATSDAFLQEKGAKLKI